MITAEQINGVTIKNYDNNNYDEIMMIKDDNYYNSEKDKILQ